jgi:hypothetical protein
VRLAWRRAQAFGAASVEELDASVGVPQGPNPPPASDAREAIGAAGGQLLEGDWFWFPRARRNRLATVASRILAVASPLEVATVRAGMCRSLPPRDAALVPPPDVMAALFAAHPRFTLDRPGRVRPARPLDGLAGLPATDRIFVAVLRESWTGVLDDASFRAACAAHGMTPAAFAARSPRSPVLDQPDDDLWCLRGTRVSAITAAALRYARGYDAPDSLTWLEP